MGKELHHPIMSMLWGYGGRVEIYIYRVEHLYCSAQTSVFSQIVLRFVTISYMFCNSSIVRLLCVDVVVLSCLLLSKIKSETQYDVSNHLIKEIQLAVATH